MEQQIALLKEASKEALEYDSRIVKVDVRYNFNTQDVTIYNSDGKIVKDSRTRGRCYIMSIAAKPGAMQTGGKGPGAQRGFEFFNEFINLKEIARPKRVANHGQYQRRKPALPLPPTRASAYLRRNRFLPPSYLW